MIFSFNYLVGIFLFFFWGISVVFAQSANVIVPEQGATSLSSYLYFYEDKKGELSFEQIRKKEEEFTANQKLQPSFGFTRSVIWGKFTVAGKAGGNTLWYILLGNTQQDQVVFYLPDDSGVFQKHESGLKAKNTLQTFSLPEMAIPLELSAGQSKTIYFMASNKRSMMQLPLQLLSSDALQKHQSSKSMFHGLYYGLMLALLIYNLFIYLIVREKSYLYYSFYVLFTVLTLAGLHGRLLPLSGLDFAAYHVIFVFTTMLAPVATIFFTAYFLQTRVNTPRLHFVMMVYVLLYLVYAVASMFTEGWPAKLFYLLLTSGSTVLLVAGFKLYRGHRYARYYTHAWLAYLILMLMYTMSAVNIHLPFYEYYLEVGGMLEALLISLALADRIRDLQEEKKRYSMVQRDLAMAEEVQKYLFPKLRLVNQGYTVASRYQPSSSLSGDFFDYYLDAEKNLCLLMVDVAGHGYAAGLIASMIKVAFHETRHGSKTLMEHQREINRVLVENVQSNFATALNIRINVAEKKISAVRSGHPPVFFLHRAQNRVETLAPRGLPLGVLDNYSCEQAEINYTAGDRLLLFTDGITEAVNPAGEEYGEEQLKARLLASQGLKSEEFADQLLAEVNHWRQKGEPADDITFVIIDFS